MMCDVRYMCGVLPTFLWSGVSAEVAHNTLVNCVKCRETTTTTTSRRLNPTLPRPENHTRAERIKSTGRCRSAATVSCAFISEGSCVCIYLSSISRANVKGG